MLAEVAEAVEFGLVEYFEVVGQFEYDADDMMMKSSMSPMRSTKPMAMKMKPFDSTGLQLAQIVMVLVVSLVADSCNRNLLVVVVVYLASK